MKYIEYKNIATVSLANLEEIPYILEILEKRCIWMEYNNIKQWKSNSYTVSFDKDYFAEQINKNRVYVTKINNKICGIFLLNYEDPKFWKDSKYAVYIHHLATDINYKGLGKFMIDKIKEFATKNNIQYIRLDCVRNNQRLNKYYEDLGFVLKHSGTLNTYSYNLREFKLY